MSLCSLFGSLAAAAAASVAETLGDAGGGGGSGSCNCIGSKDTCRAADVGGAAASDGGSAGDN